MSSPSTRLHRSALLPGPSYLSSLPPLAFSRLEVRARRARQEFQSARSANVNASVVCSNGLVSGMPVFAFPKDPQMSLEERKEIFAVIFLAHTNGSENVLHTFTPSVLSKEQVRRILDDLVELWRRGQETEE
jgi:hypothetical protein